MNLPSAAPKSQQLQIRADRYMVLPNLPLIVGAGGVAQQPTTPASFKAAWAT